MCDPIPPDFIDPFNLEEDPHLRTDGTNRMRGVLRITDGVEHAPGLTFDNDPRTGVGRNEDGNLFISVQALRGLTVFPPGFVAWQVAGIFGQFTHANTQLRTWTAPNKSGTLALLDDIGFVEATNSEAFTIQAGQPVCITGDGTIGLARANNVATLGFAFMAEQTGSGQSGRIVTNGFLEVADWTPTTGSATLVPGTEYFLSPSVPGVILDAAPGGAGTIVQIVGRAFSQTVMAVEFSKGIIL